MFDLEDYKRMANESKSQVDNIHKECEEIRRKELEKQGIIMDSDKNQNKRFHGDCNHPDAMERGTAIILYILTIIVGAIFNDRWLIWAVATAIFFKSMNKHTK